MRLARKDAIATALTAGIIALYVAFLQEAYLPLLASARSLAAVLFVLSVAACAVDAGAPDRMSPHWTTSVGQVVGSVSVLAAITTVATGNALGLAVLVGSIVTMWALTTVQHALTGPPVEPPAAELPSRLDVS